MRDGEDELVRTKRVKNGWMADSSRSAVRDRNRNVGIFEVIVYCSV